MSIRQTITKYALIGAVSVGVPVVAYYEGLREKAYIDPVGVPTICYGHTETAKIGQVKTKAECDALLESEYIKFLIIVDKNVKVPVTDYTLAALASFAYNVGERNFKNSTLLKMLNSGDTVGACNQLRRWVYAKGVKFEGLVKRREAERKLCLTNLPQNLPQKSYWASLQG